MAPSLNQTELSKVSVIIPTYNQWAMLGETLDSVFAQTLVPVEVIVVDDGSTDETPEKFSNDPRLKYIRQENAGSSTARNTGLLASTGDFILSLDHDDLLHPEYLERAMSAFEQFPEANAVWSNFGIFGSEDFSDYLTAARTKSVARDVADFVNMRRCGRDLFLWDEQESEFLYSHFGPTSNSAMVLRRNILDGWNPKFRIIDDWGLMLNVVTSHPCPTACICRPTWSRRVGLHNSSRLGSKLQTAVNDWEVLVKDYGPRVAPSASCRYRKFLAGLHLDLGFRLSTEGALPQALAEYWRSFRVQRSPKPLWWMLRATGRHLIVKQHV